MFQGESLPVAHARIYRAMSRHEAITKAKSVPKTTHGPNPIEKETEQELADKLVPAGSMADRAILHSVQANLWDMAGEFHCVTILNAMSLTLCVGSNTLSGLHSDLAFESSTSRTDIDLNLAIMEAKRVSPIDPPPSCDS